MGQKHDRKVVPQQRRSTNGSSSYIDSLGHGHLAKYVAAELVAGRAPTIPLKSLAEHCGAACAEGARALCTDKASSTSPRLGGAEDTLLDLYSCDAEGNLDFELRDEALGTRAPIELLRDALRSHDPLPSAPPEFTFDPSAFPAATESVFVVSSAEFPNQETWMSFCEANVKADLVLATLNQIVTKFVQSLTQLATQRDHREYLTTESPSSGEESATVVAPPAALVPTIEGLPLANPEGALIAAVRDLTTPESGVLTACPLTTAEEGELCALCEQLAMAAQLPAEDDDARDYPAVARRCEAAHAYLREALVRFQSQQMHRWLHRRAQLSAQYYPRLAQHALGVCVLAAFRAQYTPPPKPDKSTKQAAAKQGTALISHATVHMPSAGDDSDATSEGAAPATDGVGTLQSSTAEQQFNSLSSDLAGHSSGSSSSAASTSSFGAGHALEPAITLSSCSSASSSASSSKAASARSSCDHGAQPGATPIPIPPTMTNLGSVRAGASSSFASLAVTTAARPILDSLTQASSPGPSAASEAGSDASTSHKHGHSQTDLTHVAGSDGARGESSGNSHSVGPSPLAGTTTGKAGAKKKVRSTVTISAAAMRAQAVAAAAAHAVAATDSAASSPLSGPATPPSPVVNSIVGSVNGSVPSAALPLSATSAEGGGTVAVGPVGTSLGSSLGGMLAVHAKKGKGAHAKGGGAQSGRGNPRWQRGEDGSGVNPLPLPPRANKHWMAQHTPYTYDVAFPPPLSTCFSYDGLAVEAWPTSPATATQVLASAYNPPDPSIAAAVAAAAAIPAADPAAAASWGPVSTWVPGAYPTGNSYEDRLGRVRWQIEYYFSNQNLVRDSYLRCLMDEDGWVPLVLLSTFPKVAREGLELRKVVSALAQSRCVSPTRSLTHISSLHRPTRLTSARNVRAQ